MGDVVVLEAELMRRGRLAERDADRRDRIAEGLVARSRRHDLAGEGPGELVRDEGGRRLARVTGGRRGVGEGRRRSEAALEPAPGEPRRVQLVTDVLPREPDRVAGRAVVPVGLCVARQREAAGAVGRDVGIRSRRGRDRRVVRLVRDVDAAGVAGDEVDRAGRRGAERRPVRVVADREVLCLVPEAGDGVAVVVVHDRLRIAQRPPPWCLRRSVRAAVGADALDELVHRAAVERLLLVAVVVILVARDLAAGAAGKSRRAGIEPPRAAR